MERLFAAGALDCWLTPVQMKKSRPGTVLSVLADPSRREELERIIFANTTTLGIRRTTMKRSVLDRHEVMVASRYGDIRLKLAVDAGRVLRARPEYDDCAALARLHDIPLADVWDDAHRMGDRLIGRDLANLD